MPNEDLEYLVRKTQKERRDSAKVQHKDLIERENS